MPAFMDQHILKKFLLYSYLDWINGVVGQRRPDGWGYVDNNAIRLTEEQEEFDTELSMVFVGK